MNVLVAVEGAGERRKERKWKAGDRRKQNVHTIIINTLIIITFWSQVYYPFPDSQSRYSRYSAELRTQ